MSYEIEYKKCNIMLSNGNMIPFSQSGSNNCYDISDRGGSGRRARSWSSHRFFTTNKTGMDTPENIKANMLVYIHQVYAQDRSEPITDEFPTFEDFIEKGNSMYWLCNKVPGKGTIQSYISWVTRPTTDIATVFERIKSIELFRYIDSKPDYSHADSEEELIAKLQEGFSIAISEHMMNLLLKHINSKAPSKPREKKQLDTAYVIKYGGSFISFFRGGSFRYRSYQEGARVFKTEAQATAAMKGIKQRQSESVGGLLSVEKITGSFEF